MRVVACAMSAKAATGAVRRTGEGKASDEVIFKRADEEKREEKKATFWRVCYIDLFLPSLGP